jgi:Uncharacterised nucleotidyltransferase
VTIPLHTTDRSPAHFPYSPISVRAPFIHLSSSLQPRPAVEPSAPPAAPRLRPAPVPIRVPHPPSVPNFSRPLHNRSDRPPLSADKKIREALLLVFCDPIPTECLRLWLLSRADWQRALRWLDIGGLALYFLDRLEQHNLTSLLPAHVLDRLHCNLADNTMRTAALMTEWIGINRAFQSAGLSYATLKGFSLGPPSVPRLEFRSQLDLDFLIAEASAPEARRLLEQRGFRIRGSHGRSWEFVAHDEQDLTLRDLYKPTPHRYLELHLESSSSPSPLLKRPELRRMHDLCLPVLQPVDLFLGQGLHVFKHLSGESTRASHLVEFRRHCIARSGDLDFWRRLRLLAENDPRHPIGLGVVILLITRLMGPFAPPAFTSWAVDPLPPAARLWAETCAHDVILSSPPCTKLYLLLEEVLASAGIPPRHSAARVLFPRKLPQSSVPVEIRERLAVRLGRRWRRINFILVRARFHLVENLRYWRISRRFRKSLARIDP